MAGVEARCNWRQPMPHTRIYFAVAALAIVIHGCSSPAVSTPTRLAGVTEFQAGISGSPFGITAGPDGNLWFTEGSAFVVNRIGRLTTSGTLTEFSSGISGASFVARITRGPDGNLWFTA